MPNLGHAYVKSKRFDDARRWLEAAAEDGEALQLHSEVLFAAEQFDELITIAGARATQNEGDCATRLMLARGYNVLRDPAEAESWARQEIACSPKSVDGRLELVAALIGQLQPDFSTTEEAEADLRKALDATEAAGDLADNDRQHETAVASEKQNEVETSG